MYPFWGIPDFEDHVYQRNGLLENKPNDYFFTSHQIWTLAPFGTIKFFSLLSGKHTSLVFHLPFQIDPLWVHFRFILFSPVSKYGEPQGSLLAFLSLIQILSTYYLQVWLEERFSTSSASLMPRPRYENAYLGQSSQTKNLWEVHPSWVNNNK
jgi:hypothetical protein